MALRWATGGGRTRWVLASATALLMAASGSAQSAPAALVEGGGRWVRVADLHRALKQAATDGAGLAVDAGIAGAGEAWRCVVEPALGAEEAGLWFQCGRDGKTGFLCALRRGAEGTL